MAIGVLSDDVFLEELSRFNKPDSDKQSSARALPNNNAIVQDLIRGRGDKANTPMSIRKLVAEEAINGTSGGELAEKFNISRASVSAYKHGNTSLATYNEQNDELAEHIDFTKEDISKRARARLMDALSQITPEKIASQKVSVASQIAKDMSAIVKNIEPQKDTNNGPNVQYVIYAPQIKKEDDFEVKEIIDVS